MLKLIGGLFVFFLAVVTLVYIVATATWLMNQPEDLAVIAGAFMIGLVLALVAFFFVVGVRAATSAMKGQ